MNYKILPSRARRLRDLRSHRFYVDALQRSLCCVDALHAPAFNRHLWAFFSTFNDTSTARSHTISTANLPRAKDIDLVDAFCNAS